MMMCTLISVMLCLLSSKIRGHCNTDHIIHQNPDGTVNKLSEYKRRMKRRHRQTQLEERGSDRWDLPRIPGGRRRRLKRDADAPSAPPEPPQTGYVIYVSQMTTKLRHDNPDRHHNQISAVRRISSMWNNLSEKERDHYTKLARDARTEYENQLMEYRATGHWSPSTTFTRLSNNKNGHVRCRGNEERSTGSNGPWVRIPYAEKNGLEKELDSYEQVIFPPRPKSMEKEHEEKVKEQKKRRKERMKDEYLKYNMPIQNSSKQKVVVKRRRSKKNPDGTMTPASEPQKLQDGTYAKPKTKVPKGYEWCAKTGVWIPIKQQKMESDDDDR